MPGEPHALAKEVSTQSVEGAMWFFLLLVNARLESVIKGRTAKYKETRTWWFENSQPLKRQKLLKLRNVFCIFIMSFSSIMPLFLNWLQNYVYICDYYLLLVWN